MSRGLSKDIIAPDELYALNLAHVATGVLDPVRPPHCSEERPAFIRKVLDKSETMQNLYAGLSNMLSQEGSDDVVFLRAFLVSCAWRLLAELRVEFTALIHPTDSGPCIDASQCIRLRDHKFVNDESGNSVLEFRKHRDTEKGLLYALEVTRFGSKLHLVMISDPGTSSLKRKAGTQAGAWDEYEVVGSESVVRHLQFQSTSTLDVAVEGADFTLGGDDVTFYILPGCSPMQTRSHLDAIFAHISSMVHEIPPALTTLLDAVAPWRSRDGNLDPPLPEWEQALNRSQFEAISSLSRSVEVIKAPPGTGKTHLARYIAMRAHAAGMKVLVTSSMNAAVEAAFLAFKKHMSPQERDARILTYGHESRVSNEVLQYLAQTRERRLSDNFTDGARDVQRAIDERYKWIQHQFAELAARRPVTEGASTGSGATEALGSGATEDATEDDPIITRAIRSEVDSMLGRRRTMFNGRSWGASSFDTFFGTLDSIPRLVRLLEATHDDEAEQPRFRPSAIVNETSELSPLIDCIILDEGGTVPIHALPMLFRLRPRCVIVTGDLKQLPPHSNITVSTPLSIMRHVLETREELCRKENRPIDEAARELDMQYRCGAVACGLTSSLFYEGRLQTDRVTAADRAAKAEALGMDEVSWISVPRDSFGEDEMGGPLGVSTHRPAEVAVVLERVRAILMRDKDRAPTILVATPYKAQYSALAAALRESFPDVYADSARAGSFVLVRTFTTAQGSEYDHVVLSLVRANRNNIVGFLSTDSRSGAGNLCVALSRHRITLTLIGCDRTFANSRSRHWGEIVGYCSSVKNGMAVVPRNCAARQEARADAAIRQVLSSLPHAPRAAVAVVPVRTTPAPPRVTVGDFVAQRQKNRGTTEWIVVCGAGAAASCAVSSDIKDVITRLQEGRMDGLTDEGVAESSILPAYRTHVRTENGTADLLWMITLGPVSHAEGHSVVVCEQVTIIAIGHVADADAAELVRQTEASLLSKDGRYEYEAVAAQIGRLHARRDGDQTHPRRVKVSHAAAVAFGWNQAFCDEAVTADQVEEVVAIATKSDIRFIELLSSQQKAIVRLQHPSVLVEGRGGTGKTIVLMYRMFAYQNTHARIMPRATEDDAGALSNPVPYPDFPVLFVTRSPNLISDVAHNYNKLIGAGPNVQQLGLPGPFVSMVVSDLRAATTARKVPANQRSCPSDMRMPLFTAIRPLLVLLDGMLLRPRADGVRDHTHSPFDTTARDSRCVEPDDDDEAETFGRGRGRYEVGYDDFIAWCTRVRPCRAAMGLEDSMWSEIVSIIKGSAHAAKASLSATRSGPPGLTLDQYVALPQRDGWFHSRVGGVGREEVHAVWLRYEAAKLNGEIIARGKRRQRSAVQGRRPRLHYDELDVVHMVLRATSDATSPLPLFEWLHVDEMQDLTMVHLTLLFHLSGSHAGVTAGRMLLAGDTSQTIVRGLLFKFEAVKDAITMHMQGADQSTSTGSDRVAVKKLTENYRCTGEVLRVANAVVRLLEGRFPSSIDVLPLDFGRKRGPTPLYVQSTKTLAAILNDLIDESDTVTDRVQDRWTSIQAAVLTRHEHDKRKLEASTYTVEESKGLEFPAIIVHNFFSSSAFAFNKWKDLVSRDLVPSDFRAPSEDDPAVFCARSLEAEKKMSTAVGELKALYTAVTRASEVLIFVEDGDVFDSSGARADSAALRTHMAFIEALVRDGALQIGTDVMIRDVLKPYVVVECRRQIGTSAQDLLDARKYSQARKLFEKIGMIHMVALTHVLEGLNDGVPVPAAVVSVVESYYSVPPPRRGRVGPLRYDDESGLGDLAQYLAPCDKELVASAAPVETDAEVHVWNLLVQYAEYLRLIQNDFGEAVRYFMQCEQWEDALRVSERLGGNLAVAEFHVRVGAWSRLYLNFDYHYGPMVPVRFLPPASADADLALRAAVRAAFAGQGSRRQLQWLLTRYRTIRFAVGYWDGVTAADIARAETTGHDGDVRHDVVSILVALKTRLVDIAAILDSDLEALVGATARPRLPGGQLAAQRPRPAVIGDPCSIRGDDAAFAKEQLRLLPQPDQRPGYAARICAAMKAVTSVAMASGSHAATGEERLALVYARAFALRVAARMERLGCPTAIPPSLPPKPCAAGQPEDSDTELANMLKAEDHDGLPAADSLALAELCQVTATAVAATGPSGSPAGALAADAPMSWLRHADAYMRAAMAAGSNDMVTRCAVVLQSALVLSDITALSDADASVADRMPVLQAAVIDMAASAGVGRLYPHTHGTLARAVTSAQSRKQRAEAEMNMVDGGYEFGPNEVRLLSRYVLRLIGGFVEQDMRIDRTSRGTLRKLVDIGFDRMPMIDARWALETPDSTAYGVAAVANRVATRTLAVALSKSPPRDAYSARSMIDAAVSGARLMQVSTRAASGQLRLQVGTMLYRAATMLRDAAASPSRPLGRHKHSHHPVIVFGSDGDVLASALNDGRLHAGTLSRDSACTSGGLASVPPVRVVGRLDQSALVDALVLLLAVGRLVPAVLSDAASTSDRLLWGGLLCDAGWSLLSLANSHSYVARFDGAFVAAAIARQTARFAEVVVRTSPFVQLFTADAKILGALALAAGSQLLASSCVDGAIANRPCRSHRHVRGPRKATQTKTKQVVHAMYPALVGPVSGEAEMAKWRRHDEYDELSGRGTVCTEMLVGLDDHIARKDTTEGLVAATAPRPLKLVRAAVPAMTADPRDVLQIPLSSGNPYTHAVGDGELAALGQWEVACVGPLAMLCDGIAVGIVDRRWIAVAAPGGSAWRVVGDAEAGAAPHSYGSAESQRPAYASRTEDGASRPTRLLVDTTGGCGGFAQAGLSTVTMTPMGRGRSAGLIVVGARGAVHRLGLADATRRVSLQYLGLLGADAPGKSPGLDGVLYTKAVPAAAAHETDVDCYQVVACDTALTVVLRRSVLRPAAGPGTPVEVSVNKSDVVRIPYTARFDGSASCAVMHAYAPAMNMFIFATKGCWTSDGGCSNTQSGRWSLVLGYRDHEYEINHYPADVELRGIATIDSGTVFATVQTRRNRMNHTADEQGNKMVNKISLWTWREESSTFHLSSVGLDMVPDGLSISPDGTCAYVWGTHTVAGRTKNVITIIDVRAAKVRSTVEVPGRPRWVVGSHSPDYRARTMFGFTPLRFPTGSGAHVPPARSRYMMTADTTVAPATALVVTLPTIDLKSRNRDGGRAHATVRALRCVACATSVACDAALAAWLVLRGMTSDACTHPADSREIKGAVTNDLVASIRRHQQAPPWATTAPTHLTPGVGFFLPLTAVEAAAAAAVATMGQATGGLAARGFAEGWTAVDVINAGRYREAYGGSAIVTAPATQPMLRVDALLAALPRLEMAAPSGDPTRRVALPWGTRWAAHPHGDVGAAVAVPPRETPDGPAGTRDGAPPSPARVEATSAVAAAGPTTVANAADPLVPRADPLPAVRVAWAPTAEEGHAPGHAAVPPRESAIGGTGAFGSRRGVRDAFDRGDQYDVDGRVLVSAGRGSDASQCLDVRDVRDALRECVALAALGVVDNCAMADGAWAPCGGLELAVADARMCDAEGCVARGARMRARGVLRRLMDAMGARSVGALVGEPAMEGPEDEHCRDCRLMNALASRSCVLPLAALAVASAEVVDGNALPLGAGVWTAAAAIARRDAEVDSDGDAASAGPSEGGTDDDTASSGSDLFGFGDEDGDADDDSDSSDSSHEDDAVVSDRAAEAPASDHGDEEDEEDEGDDDENAAPSEHDSGSEPEEEVADHGDEEDEEDEEDDDENAAPSEHDSGSEPEEEVAVIGFGMGRRAKPQTKAASPEGTAGEPQALGDGEDHDACPGDDDTHAVAGTPSDGDATALAVLALVQPPRHGSTHALATVLGRLRVHPTLGYLMDTSAEQGPAACSCRCQRVAAAPIPPLHALPTTPVEWLRSPAATMRAAFVTSGLLAALYCGCAARLPRRMSMYDRKTVALAVVDLKLEPKDAPDGAWLDYGLRIGCRSDSMVKSILHSGALSTPVYPPTVNLLDRDAWPKWLPSQGRYRAPIQVPSAENLRRWVDKSWLLPTFCSSVSAEDMYAPHTHGAKCDKVRVPHAVAAAMAAGIPVLAGTAGTVYIPTPLWRIAGCLAAEGAAAPSCAHAYTRLSVTDQLAVAPSGWTTVQSCTALFALGPLAGPAGLLAMRGRPDAAVALLMCGAPRLLYIKAAAWMLRWGIAANAVRAADGAQMRSLSGFAAGHGARERVALSLGVWNMTLGLGSEDVVKLSELSSTIVQVTKRVTTSSAFDATALRADHMGLEGAFVRALDRFADLTAPVFGHSDDKDPARVSMRRELALLGLSYATEDQSLWNNVSPFTMDNLAACVKSETLRAVIEGGQSVHTIPPGLSPRTVVPLLSVLLEVQALGGAAVGARPKVSSDRFELGGGLRALREQGLGSIRCRLIGDVIDGHVGRFVKRIPRMDDVMLTCPAASSLWLLASAKDLSVRIDHLPNLDTVDGFVAALRAVSLRRHMRMAPSEIMTKAAARQLLEAMRERRTLIENAVSKKTLRSQPAGAMQTLACGLYFCAATGVPEERMGGWALNCSGPFGFSDPTDAGAGMTSRLAKIGIWGNTSITCVPAELLTDITAFADDLQLAMSSADDSFVSSDSSSAISSAPAFEIRDITHREAVDALIHVLRPLTKFATNPLTPSDSTFVHVLQALSDGAS